MFRPQYIFFIIPKWVSFRNEMTFIPRSFLQKWLVSNKLYSGIMWQPVWTRSWTKHIPISCKITLKVFIPRASRCTLSQLRWSNNPLVYTSIFVTWAHTTQVIFTLKICIFERSNEKNHFSKTKIYFHKKTTPQLLGRIGLHNMKVGVNSNSGRLATIFQMSDVSSVSPLSIALKKC